MKKHTPNNAPIPKYIKAEVLDKIISEIEEVQNFAFITHENYVGLRAALTIIKKYKESEG